MTDPLGVNGKLPAKDQSNQRCKPRIDHERKRNKPADIVPKSYHVAELRKACAHTAPQAIPWATRLAYCVGNGHLEGAAQALAQVEKRMRGES